MGNVKRQHLLSQFQGIHFIPCWNFRGFKPPSYSFRLWKKSPGRFSDPPYVFFFRVLLSTRNPMIQKMAPLRLVHKVEQVSVAWIVLFDDSTNGKLVGLGLKVVVGIPGIPLFKSWDPLIKSWVNWWFIGLIPGIPLWKGLLLKGISLWNAKPPINH